MLAEVVDSLPAGAGPIGLLSGDEFTPAARAFDRELIARTGRRVGVLTSADPANGVANAQLARAHLADLQAEATHIAALPADLTGTDLLYIAGGDPRVLLGSVSEAAWTAVEARWRAGMGIAGASAGAMALSTHCLIPQPGDDKPTVWARGLGPLERFGLAVHATTRPRSWLQHVAKISRLPVVALDDSIGMIIQAGNEPVVIGRGRAWIATDS